MRVVLLVLMWGLALPAWAGWRNCPGDTTNSNADEGKLSGAGHQLCLRQATATDPTRVSGGACKGGIDVIFASDIAGTNYDATLYVYQCPAGGVVAGTFTDCEKVLPSGVDAALTGNPVANLDAIYGISPGWLAFDIANGSSRTLEVRLICK